MKLFKFSSYVHIFITLIFFVFCIINCSDDNPTKSNESTIISGNVKMDLHDGFDFSVNDTIKVNYFNLESSQQNINQIDIFISNRTLMPISSPSVFHLIGSPVAIQTPLFAGYIAGPDSSMPAIKILNYNNLDDIMEVSESDFQLSLELQSVNSIYAVKTQDKKYAIIKITEIDTLSDIPNFSFDWKYQSNGSRSFN